VTNPALVVFAQKVSTVTMPVTRQNSAAIKNKIVALTRDNTSALIKLANVKPASHKSMTPPPTIKMVITKTP
jgi:hypothetical protein